MKFIIFLNLFIFGIDAFSKDESSDFKIQVHGYPTQPKKTYLFENINPLQPENLSLSVPGLTIAKLGSLGQKTSLRYGIFSSGDMTFLYDGFEISDSSDPSEGFDLSSFLITPQFDFSLSRNATGLFSRQTGGVLNIDPKFDEGYLFKSSVGSESQGLLSFQKNSCFKEECFQISSGGTIADGQSAATKGSDKLENDPSKLAFLTLGWVKPISLKSGSQRFLKLRSHTQYSKTDIDDYDETFIFRDDPNADLTFLNQFLGLSYLTNNDQYFFENTFSKRDVLNNLDALSKTERQDSYQVLRNKLRGVHNINNIELFWSTQNLNLKTENLTSKQNISKLEINLQADQKIKMRHLSLLQSANFNALESFDSGFGISQTIKMNPEGRSISTFQTQYGYKDRRPSFFQLFDPQFGNANLKNESQFFVRPQLDFNFGSSGLKHNISIQYSYEDLSRRVVFINIGDLGYKNSGQLNSSAATLEYSVKSMSFNSKAFFRQSFDKQSVMKSLPWTAQNEVGFGAGFNSRHFTVSTEIKWLMDMYNPSQNKINQLVQSQASLSYQLDTNDRISLQLNNLFNDKKIWDEGFNRQPFSWMMSLTKKI